MLAKFNHVATVVAGIDLLVKALSLLRLHCYHQWIEGFECSLQQHSKLWQTLAKKSCKIQSNLD
jgi:midasin (ATPase involved in ribosome maturation)